MPKQWRAKLGAHKPTYDIEAYTHGQWLWVILPAYKTREAAQADADRMTAKSGTPHRVTEP